MERVLCILALMAFAPVFTLAQSGGAEQQILALEDQDRETTVRGDASAFRERYLADEFVELNASGAVYTKADAIAFAKSDAVKFDSISVDNQTVRVYGDTAVVTGRAHVRGTGPGGRAIDTRLRYTRVWVKQGDQWKIVAFQLTPIVEAAAPPGE